MSLLIKNAQIVTASSFYTADIFISNGKIESIGKNLSIAAHEVLDAKGNWVIPGAIDPHVHLDMPFMGTFSSDSYETGTKAALFGGTTMVIDFVLQKQKHSLKEALEEWQGRSNGNCYCDYGFHMAVTDFNEATKEEIKALVELEGITSFKAFMAYKGALMIDDGQLTALMYEVKKHGGLVNVHATNGDMIDFLTQKHRQEEKLTPLYHYLSQPEITEAEATGRFIAMANYTGCPGYIVHLTCEGALNATRGAFTQNKNVFVETCIQYLLLDASLYQNESEGSKWVMSPPLREPKDQNALWAGIQQGVVQVVATDHCPFTWQQKLMGKDDFSKIPNGHPAIEHRVELLFSEGVCKGRITPQKWVELVSTNPAKIFGMFPEKGCIAVGADADLVVFDPNEKHVISATTHHMNTDYSAYEGFEVTGKIKTVFLRGQKAIHNNQCLLPKGFGRYVKRNKTSGII